jgi:OOP family OmpA-OmpF porin
MKNYLSAFVLFLLALGATAQTANHKIGLSGGAGFQKYKGELGNDFLMYHWTEYGVVSVNAGFYLDNSFDFDLLGSIGDYGMCQSKAMANKEVALKYRCPGCIGRKGLGNLNSRMASGGFALKYKLANGYIFKEDAKIAPYVYAGMCMNRITDRMKMHCVRPGDYFSINTGFGFKYNFTDRYNIGYNMSFGYFQADNIDNLVGGKNDRSMQSSVFVGVNL